MGLGVGWVARGPGPKAPPSTPPGVATRLDGYTFVRPLLECETPGTDNRVHLEALRTEFEAIRSRSMADGNVAHVSIYLRDLNSTEHLGIEEGVEFSPASLFKVPIMLMALKEAERDPTLLTTHLVFDLADWKEIPQVVAPTHELIRGNAYPLRQLLEQMIVESDNHAADVVGAHFGSALFAKMFSDLGIRTDANGGDTLITVEQYASFFRILYNASYLGPQMSELGLSLLSQVKFMRGLVAGVPEGIRVAHKFGERRYLLAGHDTLMQLHDCGVVYYPGRPYLLCVMTRGHDIEHLVPVIRDVSAAAYAHYRDRVGGLGGVALAPGVDGSAGDGQGESGAGSSPP